MDGSSAPSRASSSHRSWIEDDVQVVRDPCRYERSNTLEMIGRTQPITAQSAPSGEVTGLEVVRKNFERNFYQNVVIGDGRRGHRIEGAVKRGDRAEWLEFNTGRPQYRGSSSNPFISSSIVAQYSSAAGWISKRTRNGESAE